MKDFWIVVIFLIGLYAIAEKYLFPLFKKNDPASDKIGDTQTEKAAEKQVTYVKTPHLMTSAELDVYARIKNAVGEEYLVLPQICLASIVQKKAEEKTYQNELYRILDYVIFTKDFEPKAAVELNDSTHQQANRAERDRKVKEILSKAGIPLLTLHAGYPNAESYIRERLSEFLPELRQNQSNI